MVGQVDDGGPVGGGEVVDEQIVSIGELVGDGDIERARETFLAVGADAVKGDAEAAVVSGAASQTKLLNPCLPPCSVLPRSLTTS